MEAVEQAQQPVPRIDYRPLGVRSMTALRSLIPGPEYSRLTTSMSEMPYSCRGDLGKDVEGEEKKRWEWKLIRTKNESWKVRVLLSTPCCSHLCLLQSC